MRYGWACMACIAWIAPAQAADDLAYAAAPAWAEPQPLPTQAVPPTDAPVDFLLFDTQVKLEPNSVASYSHYAFRINNSNGLAIGNVMVAWDPAFDTATIHRVAIRRSGQDIDVLGKGQKFTILRRETNLEQQTLNGQLTATLLPEGLQVGDILQVEMTLVRRDPTLRGHMEAKGSLGLPMRVDRARMRLVAPANATIRQRPAKGLPSPTVSRKGGDMISTWTFAPLVPEQPPAFAPTRYALGRTLDVTDYQSWGDLAALFVPLFEQASRIPASSPLQPEIARIRAASTDPVVRAELALQLVEQKIRYVNLALGVGGLVPASADQTWERRFGDCKAKSALLVGLLRELGIDAVPVLVHTEEGDGMDERLPMVALFNHMVVRANVGGQTYWLDGTRAGDTRLATIEVPFYHWGLPVVRDAQLVRIMPQPLAQPLVETVIHTNASAGVDAPVPTTIELTMRGDLAIAQNVLLSSLDPTLREQTIRKQLQVKLDQFEIDKVTSVYDDATQIYRLRGEGRQTLDLSKGIYWTEVPSPGYKADFRRSGMRDSDAPVQIAYPSYSRDVQVIVLPKNRVSQTTFQVAPLATTVAGMEYRRNVTNKGGIVTIESTRRAVKAEIPYAEAVAAQERLRELDKDEIWIRLSSSAPVAVAEVKELIGREPKSSYDYLAAAVKLFNKEESEKALGALNVAIEMAPAKPEPRSLRAQWRMSDQDFEGAKEDAAAVLKIAPNDASMRMVMAELLRREGKPEEAYAQAQALSNVDTAAAQVRRGEILLTLGRINEALAAFDRALEFEKDPMTYVHRAHALPAADKEGRRRELEAALKLNPVDAPALAGLAQVASQIGDHARALQLLDQAFLRSPDSVAIRHARAIQMMLIGKTQLANEEFDAIAAKDLTADELNNICWDKALANVALDRALQECDRSLEEDEGFAARDSKAVVLLRQSKFDEAIAQFDLVLEESEVPAALYGRALAYARKGDRARSDADAERALKLAPGLDRTYSYYGLVR